MRLCAGQASVKFTLLPRLSATGGTTNLQNRIVLGGHDYIVQRRSLAMLFNCEQHRNHAMKHRAWKHFCCWVPAQGGSNDPAVIPLARGGAYHNLFPDLNTHQILANFQRVGMAQELLTNDVRYRSRSIVASEHRGPTSSSRSARCQTTRKFVENSRDVLLWNRRNRVECEDEMVSS
jgi:hypothetical protein